MNYKLNLYNEILFINTNNTDQTELYFQQIHLSPERLYSAAFNSKHLNLGYLWLSC